MWANKNYPYQETLSVLIWIKNKIIEERCTENVAANKLQFISNSTSGDLIKLPDAERINIMILQWTLYAHLSRVIPKYPIGFQALKTREYKQIIICLLKLINKKKKNPSESLRSHSPRLNAVWLSLRNFHIMNCSEILFSQLFWRCQCRQQLRNDHLVVFEGSRRTCALLCEQRSDWAYSEKNKTILSLKKHELCYTIQFFNIQIILEYGVGWLCGGTKNWKARPKRIFILSLFTSGGWGALGIIFAGYVPLASQSPYPSIVYSLANYRPCLRHFWANM